MIHHRTAFMAHPSDVLYLPFSGWAIKASLYPVFIYNL